MGQGGGNFRFRAMLHVPRLALWIIALSLFMWLVVIPIAIGFYLGDASWFGFAQAGFLTVPLILILAYIRRLIAYIVILYYWQIFGCLGIVSIATAALALVNIIFIHAALPYLPFASAFKTTVGSPSPTFFTAGFTLIALAILFYVTYRLLKRRRRTTPLVSSSNPQGTPAINPSSIQQQLQQRQQRLRKP